MAAASDLPLPSADPRHGFVCAWCRSPLSSPAVQPAASAVNFGICRACLERELERSAALATPRDRDTPTDRR